MKASKILSNLPSPELLWEFWRILPKSLLIVKIEDFAILIDPPGFSYAEKLSRAKYELPYHGYSLTVRVQKYGNIINNASLVINVLGDTATFAVLDKSDLVGDST